MKLTVLGFGCCVLLAPLPAHADPFGIKVLSTLYTATVDLSLAGTVQHMTSTGPTPVSQSLAPYVENADGNGRYVFAVADVSTDWLAIDVSSRTLGAKILTTAISDTTFQPLADGTAAIGFDYFNTTSYVNGFVSLYDQVADLELWRVTWKSIGGTVVYPDAPTGSWGHTPPILETALTSDHTYRLLMTGHSDSQGDSAAATMRVTGLHQVPEPSSLLLLSASLAGIWIFQRARMRQQGLR